MGPDCPFCGVLYEWTEGEFNEEYVFPRLFVCEGCGKPFMLDVEELKAVQEKYGGYAGEEVEETEEDWKKAREMYERGEY